MARLTGAPDALSSPRVAVVVTAAGTSERFGPGKKELVRLGERSVLDLALGPFLQLPRLEALVITAPPGREGELSSALSADSHERLEGLGAGRFRIVAGGGERRESVRLGLEALAKAFGFRGADSVESIDSLDEIIVLVHDGARPWASPSLVSRVAQAAWEKGAAVPVVPLVDTPKELDPDGSVRRHHPRAALGGAQTPQGFRLGSLLSAHRRAAAAKGEARNCTDDAELWDRFVGPVASVPGEAENRKITVAKDLPPTAASGGGAGPIAPSLAGQTLVCIGQGALVFRIGQGWDLHRLVRGRRLMIGGIEVPSDLGEEAHSDGDVLLHAIIDAILGAAALGDIGTHFPPSDEAWRNADSRELTLRAAQLVRAAGYEIGNVDCTVVLEEPKLGPYKEPMRASIASCLGLGIDAISVKAKTKEGVDATGEGRAIEAMAIAYLSSGAKPV
jgi:2-C-methyl-D-erythritol 2,4-cyclodiphosphate synthase